MSKTKMRKILDRENSSTLDKIQATLIMIEREILDDFNKKHIFDEEYAKTRVKNIFQKYETMVADESQNTGAMYNIRGCKVVSHDIIERSRNSDEIHNRTAHAPYSVQPDHNGIWRVCTWLQRSEGCVYSAVRRCDRD